MSARFPSPPYPARLAEQLEAYIADGSVWAAHPELVEEVRFNDSANPFQPDCSIAYSSPDNPEVRELDVTPDEAKIAMHAMGIARTLLHARGTLPVRSVQA